MAKAEDKDRAEMRSLSIGHSHAISAREDELNEALIKARFDYNDAVAAAFDSAFGGLNEFDEHYDGCSLCIKVVSILLPLTCVLCPTYVTMRYAAQNTSSR